MFLHYISFVIGALEMFYDDDDGDDDDDELLRFLASCGLR